MATSVRPAPPARRNRRSLPARTGGDVPQPRAPARRIVQVRPRAASAVRERIRSPLMRFTSRPAIRVTSRKAGARTRGTSPARPSFSTVIRSAMARSPPGGGRCRSCRRPATQAPDDGERLLGLGGAQRRRRLVEDQQLRAQGGPSRLHQLLLRGDRSSTGASGSTETPTSSIPRASASRAPGGRCGATGPRAAGRQTFSPRSSARTAPLLEKTARRPAARRAHPWATFSRPSKSRVPAWGDGRPRGSAWECLPPPFSPTSAWTSPRRTSGRRPSGHGRPGTACGFRTSNDSSVNHPGSS